MEIGKFFTPGRITVALVVICLVVIACAVWPDPIWNFFMKTQGGAIGLGLLSGIVSGLISAWVYGFRQKEVWQKDVKDLYQKTLGIDSVLSGQLKQLRDDYDMLLKDIAPAIGGSFTQSLFEYHPMASKEIARILSEQTKLQYERHHSRVIVQTAEDKYTVKGLKRIACSGHKCRSTGKSLRCSFEH